jgi:hypothetical protein
MMEGFSAGYKIWQTRVEESPVEQPVVHQDVFDKISSIVYNKGFDDAPLFVRLDSNKHFKVYASDEVPFKNCVYLPISDGPLRQRIPFTVGSLVAKEWLVKNFWTLDGEKYYMD